MLKHQNQEKSSTLERSKVNSRLNVTFITPDGDRTTLQVRAGDSLLDIAHEHDIDLEGPTPTLFFECFFWTVVDLIGACEGSLACSTCHVIVEPEFYDKMEEPTDEENDMLDLAPGLTETSRLGCQVIMCKDFDGIVVTLPNATRNVQSERFVDRPHPTQPQPQLQPQ